MFVLSKRINFKVDRAINMAIVTDEANDNVFLFVPNLIGYGRIVFGLLSFYYMPTNYVAATFFYFLSGILDALDGM